jgi:hypothetical protein
MEVERRFSQLHVIWHGGAIRAEVCIDAGEVTPLIDKDAKINVLMIGTSNNTVAHLERAPAPLRWWHQGFKWHIRRNR